ncbi:MAG: hypothetical protein ACREGL_07560, partial [Alphaproteobacteria bacterium]
MADSPIPQSPELHRSPRKTVESEVLKVARAIARGEQRCKRLRAQLAEAEDLVRRARFELRTFVTDLSASEIKAVTDGLGGA